MQSKTTNRGIGQKFEQLFRKSVELNKSYSIIRLKDNSMTQRNGIWVKLKNNNPCDFIVYNGVNLFYIELKSVKGKSFPLSNLSKEQEECMYKEALKDNGQKGYLIIHFRELNKVVMINILDFISLKVYLDIKAKKSFNYIEFMSYGGVEIPLYIPNDKRSNYLDLSKLLHN